MRWQNGSIWRFRCLELLPKSSAAQVPRLGRWQEVLADKLENLAVGVRAAAADHLGRAPTRAELTAARRAAQGLALSVVLACFTYRAPTRTPMRAIALV